MPHYCYHPGLSIAGNCRICMVEVEGWPRPQISCKLQPSPGMIVQTEKRDGPGCADRSTMEMLLVNHPLDCPICDQAGECHLQDYSYQLGQGKASTSTEKTKLPRTCPSARRSSTTPSAASSARSACVSPRRSPDTHELDLGYRGDHEMRDHDEQGEFKTPYSMNIIDICPVGALTSRRTSASRAGCGSWTSRRRSAPAARAAATSPRAAREGSFLRMEPRENAGRQQVVDVRRRPPRLHPRELSDAPRRARVRGADGTLASTRPGTRPSSTAAAALKANPGDVLVDGGCTLEEMCRSLRSWPAASVARTARLPRRRHRRRR